eukprot:TRINITY_DN44803_c0_g1_i1.p1 TRINITY_DN44803_c0_g1~~TRINITY_DN44803_c0_g1_i1.p1  ORF type:complete len:164 (-),score=19.25 TRINITY_DN44803_c0_g1_i1:132-623(-)
MASKRQYRFNPARKMAWSESGANYLKGAKVGSATGFISAGPAGTALLAVPHVDMRRASTAPSLASSTEYSEHFREPRYNYCSMDRKPLMPYSPLAARSRMAVEDPPAPLKNASVIRFGGGLHTDKRRFVTTHQSFFTGEPCDPRSHPGITSSTTRFKRQMRER